MSCRENLIGKKCNLLLKGSRLCYKILLYQKEFICFSHFILSLLLECTGFFDDSFHVRVFGSQSLVLLMQVSELSLTVLVSNLKRGVARNTSFLRQLLVLLIKLGPFIFSLSKFGLRLIKLLNQFSIFFFIFLILSLNVLELLSCVG